MKKIYNECKRPLLSPPSPPSPLSSLSTESPIKTKQDEYIKKENCLTSDNSFIVDEVTNKIINYLKKVKFYNLELIDWNDMNKLILKYTITSIHNENENEYIKYFITYKQYNPCENPDKTLSVIKYGMFKHKNLNLMFRIDEFDDQISGENTVTSTLMEKYNNNYQDIISMGIIIPLHCYIKLSTPQLFYSVQPYIDNTVTIDLWIESIKYKSNFDEQVYDVFIQLCGILKLLHEVECVHGDIKPSNILIRYKTQVSAFLIDFGLSGIHNKTTNASGGTIPFCAPETKNTITNKKDGNNIIKDPQNFEYNWVKHKKSHDIWSLGFIFMTIYIFKSIKYYYHEYPNNFFLPTGEISPTYLSLIKHEYIRTLFEKHILIEESKRCNIIELNDLVSNFNIM